MQIVKIGVFANYSFNAKFVSVINKTVFKIMFL